jgi:hypothetical protein
MCSYLKAMDPDDRLYAYAGPTLYMPGMIWSMQILEYPLFALACSKEFPAYHRGHNRGLSVLVILPSASGQGPRGRRDLHTPGTSATVGKSRGRRSVILSVTEPGARDAAPILKQYLVKATAARHYSDATADSPLEAFEREALYHPVFRITKARGLL